MKGCFWEQKGRDSKRVFRMLRTLSVVHSFSTRWPHFGTSAVDKNLSRGRKGLDPSPSPLCPADHSPFRMWNWSAVSQKPRGPGSSKRESGVIQEDHWTGDTHHTWERKRSALLSGWLP